MATVRKYHGLTLEEIKSRYYVRLTGEENTSEIKVINGKLSKLWQDVAYYYMDSMSQLKFYHNKLKAIDETLDLERKKVEWKYITENKVLPVKSRWSDKARDVASYIETNTSELVENLNIVRETINALEEEVAIWKDVKYNLNYISERVSGNSMLTGIEAKLLFREPTNIPLPEKKEFERPNTDHLELSKINVNDDSGKLF